MKFNIRKKFDPTELPKDYFSSLIGYVDESSILKPVPKSGKVAEFLKTKTPAPNEPVNFVPLVNEKTGLTYREEYNEFSAEIADIDRLLEQIFVGRGGTWE